jgi:hypothetical protein
MKRARMAGALLAVLVIPAAATAAQLPEGWSHPTVAYDGIQSVQVPGHTAEVPVNYMPPGNYRQEMAGDDGMSMAIILRQDLELAWTLLPGGMYMEMPMDTAEFEAGPRAEGIVEYREVGREEIHGWPTTRYHVLMLEDGEEAEGDFWITDDWIPVRVEIRMREDPEDFVVMEMRELNIRPQDSSLFNLPPGARKLEGMGGLSELLGR